MWTIVLRRLKVRDSDRSAATVNDTTSAADSGYSYNRPFLVTNSRHRLLRNAFQVRMMHQITSEGMVNLRSPQRVTFFIGASREIDLRPSKCPGSRTKK
jgi:hypothetical protein